MAEKCLPYRGDVRAAVGIGNRVAFVTVHTEQQPTHLYRLHAEDLTVESEALPCGGLAVLADGETIWIAGTDKRIYRRLPKDKQPKPQKTALESAATALTLLSEERLAALAGNQVVIFSRKNGSLSQTLELPSLGTAMASDPTGNWLVVGTDKGSVLVFECEEKPQFLLSESDKLHEGGITSLLFEPEELRFFSAGLDEKLLLTHARGKLEPEDRGRGAGHDDRITAMTLGLEDRFYTGSFDATVKNWTRSGGQRPATLRDVAKVVALTRIEIHGRPHLVVACADNSFRLFLLDPSGKIGQRVHKIDDAYASARLELSQNDTSRREAALKALAGYNDVASLTLIAECAKEDSDHGLRLTATRLLAESGHPRAGGFLKTQLKQDDEAVRLVAFDGLRKLHGDADLQPLLWALDVGQANVGVAAVEALQKLAKKDDQALEQLKSALSRKPIEVRRAVMTALEAVFDAKSPEANLIAIRSKHADIRRLALVRLLHRKMLDRAEVQATLRQCLVDSDADVRRTAFLVSLFLSVKLVEAVRKRDPELHRQLHELETTTFESEKTTKKTAKKAPKKSAKKQTGKPRKTKLDLAENDYVPLLQAMASRALDTCLLGGRCLALLGDPRAFGLLLQLSREDDAKARVEVCRSLAALEDPRSMERLATLLRDNAAEVRDAAFSALALIHQKQPLQVVEFGLGAGVEDVARRGLKVLIREIRKKTPKKAGEPTWDLLLRALNDPAASVRSEAFKAALNVEVAGGGEKTLRFVLASMHDDIRREVLTDVMARYTEPWAEGLLFELFNDPSADLRADAFEFAAKRAKKKEVAFLEQAIVARYPDVRKQAVSVLARKHTKAAQQLLVKTMDDEEREIRQLAVTAILDVDAEDVLKQALSNQHVDVRLKAATARARHADPAALEPLLSLACVEEPEEKTRLEDWLDHTEQALEGLGVLGDPTVFDQLLPLLQSRHPNLRESAANALVGIARAGHAEGLHAALRHEDKQVKYRAALALALACDTSAAPLVFSKKGTKILDERQRMAAAVTLGPVGENFLFSLLDQDDPSLCKATLITLLLLELKTHDGTPRRCLACLSSRMPRVRLIGARAVQCFADPAAMLALVAELINDREQQPAWSIPAESVETLANLVALAEPHVKARSLELLRHLDTKKQDAWDLHWATHVSRFDDEINQAAKRCKKQKTAKLEYSTEQLEQLAFGAYVGIVREQGAGTQGIRVRQTAINRLVDMAKTRETYRGACVPVLVQAMGDTNQVVRFQAYNGLRELGMDPSALGAEALQSRFTDLGIAGLKLLAESESTKKQSSVIHHAMMTRTDNLALEAAKLLIETQGPVKLAPDALDAASENVRQQAVAWLAESFEKEKKAQTELRKALKSRYEHVRRDAAIALAEKKDTAAFEPLVELLESRNPANHRSATAAMEQLGDPRVPDAMLDRIENDPDSTAATKELFQAIGNFRRLENVERLLGLMDQQKWRPPCFSAILKISGHDQPIEDLEDELPDKTWEEKQHPRHDAVLAKLIEKGISLGMTSQLATVLDAARWARGEEVNPPLATLAAHPDDRLRHTAVRAIGWRLRKREGSADPLVSALEHRNGDTKFLAAEGLAKAGRADGINVLLAGVEMISNVDLRSRAVIALGELADERALDMLLRLASEDAHALQESAAEAIGHLGQSNKADEIFTLLERLAKKQGGVAENALRGLRWFNTHAGWQLVHKRAQDEGFWARNTAVELLGFHDDPAARDLLLRLIAEEYNFDLLETALVSARRLWGDESLEPDYALIKNPDIFKMLEFGEPSIERVCERGDPKRMLEIASTCDDEIYVRIFVALLGRSPLPVNEAAEQLSSNQPRGVQLAAHLIGRAGTSEAKPHGKAIKQALERWRDIWTERRTRMLTENVEDDELVFSITRCLLSLIWTSGRLAVCGKILVELLEAWPDDPVFLEVRTATVNALGQLKSTKPALDALESAAADNHYQLRTTATAVLSTLDAKRASGLAEDALSDRARFDRLAGSPDIEMANTVQSALAGSHYQSVALPHAIARQDIASLDRVLCDAELPEPTRLGAIEGLAKIANEEAESKLIEFGTQEENEELRKAAWRAVRRSKRTRK